MKRLNVILISVLVITATLFQSCKKNEIEPINSNNSILPERFMVEIPDAISSYSSYKSSNVDTLQGNDIYEHMRTFIHVGEQAAEIVSEIIYVIAANNLSQPMSFTFIGEDDGRVKHVVIVENSQFEDHMWEYQMTITDEGTSETNDNVAMQIFWDKNPIDGIAILNPYNIDRNFEYPEVMYRIDYSEISHLGYESHMIVSVANLPLEDPLDNPYSMKTMKMFVGKNGDVVSLYGNSEHPNALFINGDVGFDWAFIAAGSNSEDIGVAEVGLPGNTLDSFDRDVLLVDHSIKNVFTQQIYDVWPTIDSASVQAFLYNTDAPGFFDHGGFVQGGTSPGPQYNPLLAKIPYLIPYNPAYIHSLTIDFKD